MDMDSVMMSILYFISIACEGKDDVRWIELLSVSISTVTNLLLAGFWCGLC